jgi:adenylate cyclase
MNPPSGCDAWLEIADAPAVPLAGNCSLGRSSDNQVVIASERASRRHAIIHAQEGGEFWLADLGSSNGTFLNDRRVTQPTRLKNEDTIKIAHATLTFRQNTVRVGDEDDIGASSQMTVVDLRTEECWLLIGDVANFTPLSQRMPPDDLAALMGRWIRTCKEHIERNGGAINKFLGDGFMAFWKGGPGALPKVAAAANGLRAAQLASDLEFRLVLHFGKVAMGGAASVNEDSLMGPEVNFAFRMEKAASGLKVPFCVSEGAQKLASNALTLNAVPGEHELKGFPGKYRFFALA